VQIAGAVTALNGAINTFNNARKLGTKKTPDVLYTVTFDSKGGSAVQPIDMGEGDTIFPRPADPTWSGSTDITVAEVIAAVIENGVAGAYEVKSEKSFAGWITEDGKVWNFNTDKVTKNITLSAIWGPAALDSVYDNAGDFITWFQDELYPHIENHLDRKFVIAIDKDEVFSEPKEVRGDFTIIGMGGEKKISTTDNEGKIFHVKVTGSLTLGKDVTLQGGENKWGSVVEVTGDSTTTAALTMLDGSKITGQQSSGEGTTIGRAAAVNLGEHSRFVMEGGEISGNNNIHRYKTMGSGAVYVAGAAQGNARFIMRGGVIKNNNGVWSDIVVRREAGQISLSGNATIEGGLWLEISGDRIPRRYGVTIDKDWSGTANLVLTSSMADSWTYHGTSASPSRIVGRWNEPYTSGYNASADLSSDSAFATQITKFALKLKKAVTDDSLAIQELETLDDLTGYKIGTTGILEQTTASDVNRTSLQTAITSANEAKDSAVVAENGDDLFTNEFWVTQDDMDTLIEAIEAAQTAYELEITTQTALDNARAALIAARNTFNQAKQAGIKPVPGGGDEEDDDDD
jgi:uncharacterized repeat protein (TIGR02543 family)